MDINFVTDPLMAPRPRDELIIEEFSVTPYSDGRRFRLTVEITPFAPSDRPNLEITAVDEDQTPIGSLSVIETMNRQLTLTMHARRDELPAGKYQFQAALYFEPEDILDTKVQTLTIPADIPPEN